MGLNSIPVADAALHLIADDEVLSDTVTASDTDGDSLTFSLVTTTTSGVLIFAADGAFTYTPNDNFSGEDSFTFTAEDADETSQAVIVTIMVTSTNLPPLTAPDTLGTTEDKPVIMPALKLALNDSDPDGDAITVTSVSPTSTHGTVILNGGLITYTPIAGYSGPDVFTYTITDAGGETAVGTVNVTVTPKNAVSNNLQVKFTANGFELTFATIPGRSYIIEYSSDLINWIPLTGALVAGENGLIEFVDNPQPVPPMRYYRMFEAP